MKHSITWDERRKAKQRLEGETGTIIKDWGGKLPFAFVYPNTYYIGMSNLGLQTIYGLINGDENSVCERIFWDKENRQKGSLPLSVESERPLSDFAIAAFSLNYEIDFFNIAPLLKASGIPIFSKDRDEKQPLIIAGGPCVTANPMPIAPFFDCLCIGEAEVLIPPMIPILKDMISGNRDLLLQKLSKIPGILVPRLNSETTIMRQWVKNLDDYPAHSIVLTQDTELSNLYLLEVERGCAHRCHFCMVSSAFSPMRFHSLDSLIKQSEEGLKYRRRIGLMGPAVTDHPQIEDLLTVLNEKGAQLSISSLRLTSLTPEIMKSLVRGGMRSVALAPEAGSECMRKAIKKGITESQILEAISLASEKEVQQLKLYFMIGLPDEADSDIQEIADLTLAGKRIIEKKRGKTRLVLNISPFVPKAGTVFELAPMAPLEIIQNRINFLKTHLAPQGVQIKNESPLWSEVQTVLSRGNSDLAPVLADIENETLPEWRAVVEKHHLDIDFLAHQKWDNLENIPWKIIKQN